jgi:hypothetical protein
MKNPYQNRPPHTFWRTAVVEPDWAASRGIYRKKWPIAPDEKIATAGSCFAQHIGRILKMRGFNIIDMEPPMAISNNKECLKFGYSVYSARYGNIYTTRQLLQLALEAAGEYLPEDIVWRNDAGKYFDALRPGVEPEGMDSAEEVALHRAWHLKRVRAMLKEMDLFIFTLGLTEAWMHKTGGTVYPMAPGTICGNFSAAIYAFRNFTQAEIVQDFIAFKALVHKLRCKDHPPRFLLTVSPVPLAATATDNHVLVATTYSKSVLRAAAGELSDGYADTDYFPSYEIITNPWSGASFFEANKRSATQAGLELVMQTFFAEHDAAAAPDAERSAARGLAETVPAETKKQAHIDDGVMCEEAMLETFTSQRVD